MLKSNHQPFTDELRLIKGSNVKNAAGYDDEEQTEVINDVFCSFSIGISRAEYYEALKAGVKLSATVEMWEVDYTGEERAQYCGKTYKIGRTWPTGTGTIYLYLEEVTR